MCYYVSRLRELPFMTSAPRGEGGFSEKADEVRELSKGSCVNLQTRGEGVKKSENFADVINGSPQTARPVSPAFHFIHI